MNKIYNKTIDRELSSSEEKSERLLSGYKILKIPLLSEKGRSAWPKRFPMKRIRELCKRVGKKKFQAQMQLEPVNLTDPYFNIEDFKTYEIDFIKTRDDKNITKQIEIVISILQKYDVGILHIETNGIGKFIPELIGKEIRQLRLKIEVSEIHNHNSKSIRIIEGIEPLISAEIISFNKSILSSKSFINEVKNWRPNIDGKDDGLDALSGITLKRFKNIIPSPLKIKFQ